MINLAHEKLVFVAGGGNFGSGAVKFLLKKPDWKVVISDKNKDCQVAHLVRTSTKFEEVKDAPEMTEPTLFIGDAVETLVVLLSDGIVPEIIVPCVPFHFAAKVLTSYVRERSLKVEPNSGVLKKAFESSHLEDIQYRIDEQQAVAVASKMPFDLRCAVGCNQPQICPVTKNQLRKPMYELVAALLRGSKADFVKVLRSRLMASNVGGFSGDELKQSLDFCIKNRPRTLALATSCSCHAAMNGLEIIA